MSHLRRLVSVQRMVMDFQLLRSHIPPVSGVTSSRESGTAVYRVALGILLLLGFATAAAAFTFSRQTTIYIHERKDDPNAQAMLQAAGAFLAEHLKAMTDVDPPVMAANKAPETGIHLATTPEALQAAPKQSGELERYTLEGNANVLRITSPTAIGVQHGVMAFLREQGCRWLMPSPKWWIIPTKAAITYTGKRESIPGYASRRIWYAYGPGSLPELGAWYAVWAKANQLGGARPFSTGHSYGNIIGRNAEEFAKHPDYYAADAEGKVDPKKTAAAQKFCFSNPGLRDLCLRDRIALLKTERAQNPLAFMVSMDPSDGEGTCHCANCAALGSTTDRVFSLANHVARGLRQEIPGAWVGLYAYSSHRVPPTITLEPNIHVEVAMAFNSSGLSYDELIKRWGEKAGSLGIREYYGVEAWDWGLPGRMRGGNVAYHRKQIPYFKKFGAVSINAETNANWGGQALGLYVAARMLWDPEVNVDAVVDEFLTAAYGTAAPQMRLLYADFETSPKLGTDGRARLFDKAFAALKATTDADCRTRITDILAYLVYLDYYMNFQNRVNGTEEYFTALKDLMTYAHRIESRNVVHTYALARRLCNSNVSQRRPELWLFNKEGVAWKQGAPFADTDIVKMAEALRAAYAVALKDRVSYSRDLALVTGVPAPAAQASRVIGFRYGNTAYLQPLADGDYAFTFDVAAGQKVTGAIFPHPDGAVMEEFSLAEAGTQKVTVALKAGRLYRLTLATGGASSSVTFPDKLAVALEASEEQPFWLEMGAQVCVAVPAGTKELRCTGDPRLSLVSPDGARTDVSNAMIKTGDEFVRLPVTGKAAGRAWSAGNQTRGAVAFFNVPPLLQLDPAHMLLPKEAIKDFPGATTVMK